MLRRGQGDARVGEWEKLVLRGGHVNIVMGIGLVKIVLDTQPGLNILPQNL